MLGGCNNFTTDGLVNLAKLCLNMTNVSSTYKNLSNYNQNSALYPSNKQINVATVGQDLITQLQAAGWTTN